MGPHSSDQSKRSSNDTSVDMAALAGLAFGLGHRYMKRIRLCRLCKREIVSGEGYREDRLGTAHGACVEPANTKPVRVCRLCQCTIRLGEGYREDKFGAVHGACVESANKEAGRG